MKAFDLNGPNRPIGIALLLIESVAQWQPIAASDIARRLALPKATVHRILQALHQYQWLERSGGTRPLWSLSMKPVAIGGGALEGKTGLRRAALPVMDALRHQTGETVHLGMVDGNNILLIERVDGLNSVNIFLPVGTSWDLNWSSGGKAVMANWAEEKLDEYLAKPHLQRRSDIEVIDPSLLREELRLIRQMGYGISVGRPPALSSSIGTAIFDRDGNAFASLSISGSSNRLKEAQLRSLAPELIDAARRITIGMAMS